MKRIAKLLLSALVGMMLFDAWLRLVWSFESELSAVLVFLPFLAVQAVLLHILNKTDSLIRNLVSSAIAVTLAIPGGVVLLVPNMLFNWGDWKEYVAPVVWSLGGFFGTFLVVPSLVVHVLARVRSNNRWGV